MDALFSFKNGKTSENCMQVSSCSQVMSHSITNRKFFLKFIQEEPNFGEGCCTNLRSAYKPMFMNCLRIWQLFLSFNRNWNEIFDILSQDQEYKSSCFNLKDAYKFCLLWQLQEIFIKGSQSNNVICNLTKKNPFNEIDQNSIPRLISLPWEIWSWVCKVSRSSGSYCFKFLIHIKTLIYTTPKQFSFWATLFK